jgi:hypothetical protein
LLGPALSAAALSAAVLAASIMSVLDIVGAAGEGREGLEWVTGGR